MDFLSRIEQETKLRAFCSMICTEIAREKKRIFFVYRKDSEENESESLVRAWSGDVSADSRLAVTANDDCTLKFYALKGMRTC